MSATARPNQMSCCHMSLLIVFCAVVSIPASAGPEPDSATFTSSCAYSNVNMRLVSGWIPSMSGSLA